METKKYFGAINQVTKEYVLPSYANKDENYQCPHCSKDVILKKGDIRRHHFAHKISDNPCSYYNSQGESEIHKEAKLRLKMLLETPTITISIKRKCCQPFRGKHCENIDEYVIENINENSEVVYDDELCIGKVFIEHRYKNEYKDGYSVADVAYIVNDKISYIFEVYNKHKTHEKDRIGKCWFELYAIDLINKTNNLDSCTQTIEFDCIRNTSCEECGSYEVMYQDFPDDWDYYDLPEFN